MNPVTYKGHTIEIRRDGYAKNADGQEAPQYMVLIDDEPYWTCVPLGFAPAVFDCTLEEAQNVIDEMV